MFNFQKYNFPKLGYIKIPRFHISKDEEIRLKLPPNYTSGDLLKSLINQRFIEKTKSGLIPKDKKEEYKKRLQFEVEEFIKLQFTDYILLVYNIINFCKKNNIANSYGRGSCPGSCVLFVLGVTLVDPIKHGLLFERFVSADRTDIKEIDGEIYISSGSLPDVDIDSEASKKYLVNEYLNQCFNNQTCAIANYSTLQSKVLLKEVLKAYKGFDEDKASEVSGLIETRFGKVDSITKSLKKHDKPEENNKEFQKWATSYTDVINICLGLEGLVKNKSVHASGILLCNDKLGEVIPLELSSDKKLVACYDMVDGAKFGIKIDNLGLKNLNIITETLELCNKKFEDIDVNDPDIYQFLNNSNDYYGIFQCEEGLGKKTLKSIKPQNIEDITISIAVARPGSCKYIDELVKSRNSGEKKKLDPRLVDILAPTEGIAIFQEQSMKLSQKIGGFTGSQSNTLRAGIGKKKVKVIEELKPLFFEGGRKNGFSEEILENTFNDFISAGDYSFNKCIFEEETIEHETKGLVKLKDIVIGDKILGYNEDTRLDEWVTVKNIYKNKKVCVFSEAGENGIWTSFEHKFLTQHGMISVKDCLDRFEFVKTKQGWLDFYPFYNSYHTETRILNTIDLEIDSKYHNFYCKNIVVSNSHASAYAHLTAATAYLKAKHPLEFFTASLNNAENEAESILEISTIQSELANFGIKLLPPSLAFSSKRFKIEGGSIRFPLSNIKGISNKALEHLEKFKIAGANKFQIFMSAKQAGIAINILSSLILVGAMDEVITTTRTKLVMEACLWGKLNDKEKQAGLEKGEAYKFDLLEMVRAFNTTEKKDDGKPIIKDSRMATLRKAFEPFKEIYRQNSKNEKLAAFWFEKRMLGYSYSTTLYDLYKDKCSDLNLISEIQGGIEDEYYKVIGEVLEAGLKESKNKNKYINCIIKGHDGKIKCMMFNNKKTDRINEHIELNGRMVKEGDIVICRGQRKDSETLFVDNISIQDTKIFEKISQLKD